MTQSSKEYCNRARGKYDSAISPLDGVLSEFEAKEINDFRKRDYLRSSVTLQIQG